MRRTLIVAVCTLVALAAGAPSWASPSRNPDDGAGVTSPAGGAATVGSADWVPSNPPVDLGALTTKMSDSVVTIFCGSTPASAWALDGIRMHPDAQAMGHRTALVTSYEAMQSCTYSGTRYIEMRHRGVETVAYVWNWDRGSGLALVHTNLVLEGLQWSQVPRPVVGEWVAAIGSSNGVGVAVTQGTVTRMGLRDMTTSLAVGQPGVGGPIIDNAGRALGTIVLEGFDRENRAVGNPLLCEVFIKCNNPMGVWMNFTVPGAVASPRATSLKSAVRFTWARPTTTSSASPVERYEYRRPGGTWSVIRGTGVTIRTQGKGRSVAIEVRAVNFMGPGASLLITGRSR